jgi:hypothetical protein
LVIVVLKPIIEDKSSKNCVTRKSLERLTPVEVFNKNLQRRLVEMKILNMFLFTPVFLNLSEVTYSSQDTSKSLDCFDQFMRRYAHVNRIPQSSSDIEELAISGNLDAFNLLWDLRQATDMKSESTAKAEFVRDFLVNDLHPDSITNVTNKVIEYQNDFPLFSETLQVLIDGDPEKKIILRNLKSMRNTNPIINNLFNLVRWESSSTGGKLRSVEGKR